MERWFAAAALVAVLAVAGCDRGGGTGGAEGGASSAGSEAAEADSAGAGELGADVSVDTQKVVVDSAR